MTTAATRTARPAGKVRRRPIPWDAYLLIAPALLVFAAFVLYPITRTIVLSLYDYGLTNLANARFVGLQNYREAFNDPILWRSIRNNVIILVGSVIFQVGLGLVLAALLHRIVGRGQTLFRILIFAPVVMSVVAVGLLWQLIYDPSVGILNQTLRLLNLPTPTQGWLGDPRIVIYSILAAACWQYTGFMMVIMLAGMQSVPEDMYEAANLDGANEVQMFFGITIPIIRNVIIVGMLITMIGAFKAFDIVYVLTRGGPANASQVLGSYIYYNAFTINRAGYASALAVLLLIIAVFLGLLQLRYSRSVGR